MKGWVKCSTRYPEVDSPVWIDGGYAVWRGGHWDTLMEPELRAIEWGVKRWRLHRPSEPTESHPMTPNPPPTIRSPQDCLASTLANLRWAQDCAVKLGAKYNEMGGNGDYDLGTASGFRQAIATLEAEFASYLSP